MSDARDRLKTIIEAIEGTGQIGGLHQVSFNTLRKIAAYVETLEAENGRLRQVLRPVAKAPQFKPGDKVHVIKSGFEEEGSLHRAKIGEVFTVKLVGDTVISTEAWDFNLDEIELVPADEKEPS